MERWLPVVGFEAGYEVSDQGRVRSIDRVIIQKDGIAKKRRGQVLRLGAQKSGHLYVRFGRAGIARVHVLVLEVFKALRPEGKEARHWNGVPSDNRVENLLWGTRKENIGDRVRHGTQLFGDQHPNARLTPAAALEIKRLQGQVSQAELARRFGVGKSTVKAVVDGRTWRRATIRQC